MQGYYFETEKAEQNAVTFAYVYREEDDAQTAPPVTSFHSMADNADEVVSRQAVAWIKRHGEWVRQ